MSLGTQMAKHLRDVHFGKNWTWSYLQEHLEDVTWQEASQKLEGFNSIAELTYHIHYFVKVASKYLSEGVVEGNDKFSFDAPVIASEADWQALIKTVYDHLEHFAKQVEELPDERFFKEFGEAKYGNHYRNIAGIVEHAHYHLGQIVVLKKWIRK